MGAGHDGRQHRFSSPAADVWRCALIREDSDPRNPKGTFYGMNFHRSDLLKTFLSTALVLTSLAVAKAQTPGHPRASQSAATPAAAPKSYPPELVESGASFFKQNCSFCHGRDAGGGESGPDLTRSKLVATDVSGDKIGPVVTNGRPDKGMPH